MAVLLSPSFLSSSSVRSLQRQVHLTFLCLASGLNIWVDAPGYLEDINELEEVLSPTLILPLRSPGCGQEKSGDGTGLFLFALPAGASFTFLISCSLEKYKDFRSRRNWALISPLLF